MSSLPIKLIKSNFCAHLASDTTPSASEMQLQSGTEQSNQEGNNARCNNTGPSEQKTDTRVITTERPRSSPAQSSTESQRSESQHNKTDDGESNTYYNDDDDELQFYLEL